MTNDLSTWIKVAAYGSSGLAMGFGAIGAAIGEGFAAAEANAAISRNPNISGDIFKSMLVGQAVAESASIFALVIAMMLLFNTFPSASYVTVAAMVGAGLAMGLGAIGAGVGSGMAAGAACQGMARQPRAGGRLTTNMLIGSAVCQTPAIFALVVAFILLYMDFGGKAIWPTWAAILGAGLSAGLSAVGSGIGGGTVAKSSCEGIARQPLAAKTVTNIMLLGQAIAQTPAILGLLISFMLIFRTYDATESWSASMALLSAGLCMGLGAIGPGIGEGVAASSGVKWVARSEENSGILVRTMLVGMAVSESTAIYSMVVALMLLFVV